MKILSLVFIPLPETLPIELLCFRLHLVKAPFCTFLHHVMEAIGHAIRQTRDEGVLLGQHGKDLRRVRIPCDTLRHFDGKLIGKTHYRQKLPLLFRKRIDHSGGKSGVDIGVPAGQHAALGEGAQVQIHGREPALAGIEKAFHLRIGKLCPAAVGINRKLCMVEAQLFHANLIYLAPQPHRLRGGQKAVAACNDHMHIGRQPICQHAKEQGGTLVRQQMKIVNEDVTGGFARQHVAEIVHQQPAACRVRWAGILPQEGEPCAGKRLLYALPENRKVVGIHADTDDMQRLRFGVLAEIPVHRCGFSIAHGRDHSRHGTAGNRPQALLQPLRYINGIQIPFWLWHNAHLQRIGFCIPGGFWIRCMAAFMEGTSHYFHFTSSCSARQDGVFTFFCYRLFTPRFMSRGGFCLADKSRPPPHTAVAGGMGGGLLFRKL